MTLELPQIGDPRPRCVPLDTPLTLRERQVNAILDSKSEYAMGFVSRKFVDWKRNAPTTGLVYFFAIKVSKAEIASKWWGCGDKQGRRRILLWS